MTKQGTDRVNLVKDVGASNLNQNTKDIVLKGLINDDSPKEVDGVLDKFLGSRNTKIYLVSILLLVFIVIMSIFCYIFRNDITPLVDFLQTIAPVITLAFGYIVGEKVK